MSEELRWTAAIEKVLDEENGPLNYERIAEIIEQKGYRVSFGRTPALSVHRILQQDIKENEESNFVKVEPGTFTLKKHLDQEGPADDPNTSPEDVGQQTNMIEKGTIEYSKGGVLDPSEVMGELMAALNALPDELNRSSALTPKWTKAMKLAVAKIGVGHGYDVCANGVSSADLNGNSSGGGSIESQEWLYDLIWNDEIEKEGSAIKQTRSVPLVMESEWGNLGDIATDFDKLLVANSAIKVMVCNAKTESDANSIKTQCIEAINTYEPRTRSTYLLAILVYEMDGQEDVFKFHVHHV